MGVFTNVDDVDVRSCFGGVGSRCNAHELVSCLFHVRRRMDGGIGRSSGHDSSIKCQQTRLQPPHRPPIRAAVLRLGLHRPRHEWNCLVASWPLGRHSHSLPHTHALLCCLPAWSCLDGHIGSPGHGRDGVVGLLPCCPTPCRRGATAGRYPERATRRGPSRPSMRCHGRDCPEHLGQRQLPAFFSPSVSFLPTTQRGVGVLLTGGVRIHVASQHKVGKRNLDGWRRDQDSHAPALDPCQAAIFCAAISLFSTTPLMSSGSRLFLPSCFWSCTCDSWNLFPCQAGGFFCIVIPWSIVRDRDLYPPSPTIYPIRHQPRNNSDAGHLAPVPVRR